MRKWALLISPAPVDGYPPVQYQARLLADSGYSVIVVSSQLHRRSEDVGFHYPGVQVVKADVMSLPSGPLGRAFAHISAITTARLRAGKQLKVEIAYDPLGVLYSDVAPFKPKLRVAHFHELLASSNAFLERRLPHSARRYAHVVVPDTSRAAATQAVLKLPRSPLVVENYPLREDGFRVPKPAPSGQQFDVVYCGSLGLHQRLDFIIDSIPLWPRNTRFVVVGSTNSPIGDQLVQQVRHAGLEDRVVFTGWLDLAEAESRMGQAHLGICLLDDSYEQFRTALGASNKRYQYMKAALPQIGDTNPGVPELLEGAAIGRCVRSVDPRELASLVAFYVDHPEERVAQGARAFAAHRDRFNYQAAFATLQRALGQ